MQMKSGQHTCFPKDIAEAISLAKAGEAYKYRVHGESVAAAKAANDDLSDWKQQMGELTNMVQRISCEQPKQYSANYNHNGANSQGPSRLSTIIYTGADFRAYPKK
jgi:hypothetical protein